MIRLVIKRPWLKRRLVVAGSVWRRNASPGYVTTKTPNSLGGFISELRLALMSGLNGRLAHRLRCQLSIGTPSLKLPRLPRMPLSLLQGWQLRGPVRVRGRTPVYPASGTWQQKAQYWKDLAAR